MMPKARGLTQHGGLPGWLEESDPAGVRDGRMEIVWLHFFKINFFGTGSFYILVTPYWEVKGIIIRKVSSLLLREESWNERMLARVVFFSFFSYYIQHCFICRPLDSTVPTDAGIEPRTVATGAKAVRRSNH